MAEQLTSLVRELKTLNARKKAGEELTPDEDKRRKELKRYLRAALEKEKGGDGDDDDGTHVEGVGSSQISQSSSGSGLPVRGGRPKDPFAIKADALLSKAAASMEGPAEEDTATASVDDPELVADLESPAPVAAAESPKKKDYSAAFKLDASKLFGQAEQSKAVAAAEPQKVPGGSPKGAKGPKLSAMDFNDWLSSTGEGSKGMRNSAAAIEQVGSKADEALQANKTRERVTKPEEVQLQLADIFQQSGYTAPEVHVAFEQYYGEYVVAEGLDFASPDVAGSVDLMPIDPREVELYRAGILSEAAEDEAAPVPNGLAFLDDFLALYEMGVLPPAGEEVQFDVDDPNLLIPGKRKVTVHLLNGQVKRGAIRRLARDELGFRLEPQGTGRAEDLSIQQCKAIFVHMSAKGAPAASSGRTLTVTFVDRRSVQGSSDDYAPGATMFSLIPPAGPRTGQFERIIVNAGAVKAVR